MLLYLVVVAVIEVDFVLVLIGYLMLEMMMLTLLPGG